MTSKLPFDGELVRLRDVLVESFSGEWGKADGDVLTPVLRTANFKTDGSFDYATPAMRCIPKKKVEAKMMRRGDVILEKSGGTPNRPVGIMAYYDKDVSALCSNFNQVLRFDSSLMLPRYAFYQLRWMREHGAFERYTRKTTGLQNLQMKRLGELRMIMPGIGCQRQVAETLDKIAELQRGCDERTGTLTELVKSRFVEMFGNGDWPKKSVSEVASDIRYGTSKKASEVGTYTYLRMNNMTDDGRLDFADTKRITLEGAELEKCLVRRGDVLFNRTNSREKVGKTAVFENDVPMVIAGYIIRVRFGKEIRSRYFSTFMNLPTTKKMLRDMAKGAVHQANISARQLGAIEVPVPPIDLQDDFIAFAEQADKSRVVAQKQKETLQTLYDSLAQDYFAI